MRLQDVDTGNDLSILGTPGVTEVGSGAGTDAVKGIGLGVAIQPNGVALFGVRLHHVLRDGDSSSLGTAVLCVNNQQVVGSWIVYLGLQPGASAQDIAVLGAPVVIKVRASAGSQSV